MFTTDYTWIKEQISYHFDKGNPLTAQAFQECLKKLKEKDEKINKLWIELRKYKKVKKE